MGRLYWENRQEVVGRGAYGFEARGYELGRLRLNRTRFGATTRVAPFFPRPFYVLNFGRSISMQVRGASPSLADSRELAGVVISAPHEVSLDCTAEPMLGLVLPADELRRELGATLGSEPRQPLVFEPHLALADPGAASVYRLARFVFDELEAGGSLFDAPVAVAAMEQVLRSAVLSQLRHNYSDRLAAGSAATSLVVVRRVEEYIQAHAGEPIDSETLAAVAGGSLSAVHRAFRLHRETTPMQLLRSVRMEKARESLLNPGPGATVTGIALRWGINHLGRFSVEYRKRFGESPSETLGRHSADRPVVRVRSSGENSLPIIG